VVEADIALRRGTFSFDGAFAADAPIVALFGRSGSGKTSILQAIAGILRPTRGRIAVAGRTLFDSGKGIDVAPEHRRVGFVFQDALLFPHLTVRANLAYGERLTPANERYIERARVVELLDLAKLLERRPASLSGGERQRVAIGRALLASPRLLLMDEPLASLDSPRKAEILAYIELLRDEIRLPIVYVSHALEEVTRLADHVVVIADGKVADAGPVADTLGADGMAGHRFEAGAILEAHVVSIDERYGLTTLAFDGGELAVPNLDALVGEPVRARIRARDVSVSLDRPRAISVQNILDATVVGVGEEYGAIVDVTLRVGSAVLVARITRKAADQLGLGEGQHVHALVKAVAIDRRSVGFA